MSFLGFKLEIMWTGLNLLLKISKMAYSDSENHKNLPNCKFPQLSKNIS